jgi:ribosomal protein L9
LVDLIYKHANQLNDPMSKNLMMRLAKFEECLLNFDKVLNKFAQITAAPLSPDDKGNAMEEFVLNLQGEDLPELKEKSNEKGHLFAGVTKDIIHEELVKKSRLNIDIDSIKLDKPLKEIGEHKVLIQVSGKKAEFVVAITSL